MDYQCKLCDRVMIFNKAVSDGIGNFFKYRCVDCKQYTMLLKGDQETVESETLAIGNYSLVFFPAINIASINESNTKAKYVRSLSRIVHRFSTKELTHELAVQWVKKLKTYVTFQ
jgi:hypothetical protein